MSGFVSLRSDMSKNRSRPL